MTVRTVRIALTRAAAPMEYPELGIEFVRKTIAGIKGKGSLDSVLMQPASSLLPPEEFEGPDGRFYHVMGGLIFKTSDGRAADGEPGQLVITQRRVLGMIEAGTSESGSLGLDQVGYIYCFAMSRSDISGPKIKKHLINASDFMFESTSSAGVAFTLKVYSAMACIMGDGVDYWHDRDMLHAFSSETLAAD